MIAAPEERAPQVGERERRSSERRSSEREQQRDASGSNQEQRSKHRGIFTQRWKYVFFFGGV